MRRGAGVSRRAGARRTLEAKRPVGWYPTRRERTRCNVALAKKSTKPAAKGKSSGEPQVRTREEFAHLFDENGQPRPAPTPPQRRREYTAKLGSVHHVAVDRAKPGRLAVAVQRAEQMLHVLARLADRIVDDEDATAAAVVERLWFAGAFERWDSRAAEDMAAMGVHDAVSDAAEWMNTALAAATGAPEEAFPMVLPGPERSHPGYLIVDSTSLGRHLLAEAARYALRLLATNYPDTAKRLDHGSVSRAVEAFVVGRGKWPALRAALKVAGIDTNSDDALQKQVQRWRRRRR